MEILGRYKIDKEYKVYNIITETNPDGDFIYDPFNKNRVLPFWGNAVCTFDNLNKENQNYILNNLEENENSITIRLKKYWIFWFSDGDLNTQKELFFSGEDAKTNSYQMLNIFNSLLELNIDAMLKRTKKEIANLEADLPTTIEDE